MLSLFAEYLVREFPDYDLRENGKDWKECVSSVNLLIKNLDSEPEIPEVSYFLS